jgi:hypothetical protein
LAFFFLESSSATTFANATVPAIAAAVKTFQSQLGMFASLLATLGQPLLRFREIRIGGVEEIVHVAPIRPLLRCHVPD